MATVATEMRKQTNLAGYVGFDTITKQIERKLLKRGFQFNIMVVGATGLGKSTLINTLFSAHLIDSKAPKTSSEPARQTTEIIPVTHLIEEKGVRLKLTIVDTPGYGDLINNEHCIDPITKYIKDQYAIYLRRELTAAREKHIPDTRIHSVLFFITPTGHSLKPLDLMVLKQLSEICNVIPVIAKSDTLTLEERMMFKARINEEIEKEGIRVYPYQVPDSDLDQEEADLNHAIKVLTPFAIVGSEREIMVDGKPVRGRRHKWGGIINVENEEHCEFNQLRNFLTRTHLQDLIDTTSTIHYEAFRTRQLLALKENQQSGAAAAGASQGSGSASPNQGEKAATAKAR